MGCPGKWNQRLKNLRLSDGFILTHTHGSHSQNLELNIGTQNHVRVEQADLRTDLSLGLPSQLQCPEFSKSDSVVFSGFLQFVDKGFLPAPMSNILGIVPSVGSLETFFWAVCFQIPC